MELGIEDYRNRQTRVFQNKVNHGFNTTNLWTELKLLMNEVTELEKGLKANDSENMSEELSDIVIFCYGMAEILGFDLDTAIQKKMAINEKRVYKRIVDSNGKVTYKKVESKE